MSGIGSSATWRWVLLAVVGLAVAVAVGIVASKVTSQRIGLASEPLKAGEALAPESANHGPGGSNGADHGEDHGSTTTTSTTGSTTTTNPTGPPTTTVPPTTSTDDYASGSGESGGEAGSDD